MGIAKRGSSGWAESGGGAGDGGGSGGRGAQRDKQPFARTFQAVTITSFATSPNGPVLPSDAAARTRTRRKKKQKKGLRRVNYALVTQS